MAILVRSVTSILYMSHAQAHPVFQPTGWLPFGRPDVDDTAYVCS